MEREMERGQLIDIEVQLDRGNNFSVPWDMKIGMDSRH